MNKAMKKATKKAMEKATSLSRSGNQAYSYFTLTVRPGL